MDEMCVWCVFVLKKQKHCLRVQCFAIIQHIF